jgi:hypothetical protein
MFFLIIFLFFCSNKNFTDVLFSFSALFYSSFMSANLYLIFSRLLPAAALFRSISLTIFQLLFVVMIHLRMCASRMEGCFCAITWKTPLVRWVSMCLGNEKKNFSIYVTELNYEIAQKCTFNFFSFLPLDGVLEWRELLLFENQTCDLRPTTFLKHISRIYTLFL